MQVSILLWKYQTNIGRLAWGAVGASALKIAAASSVMGVAVVMVGSAIGDAGAALQLAAMVGTGAAVFILAALALRCEELREMIHGK